MALKHFDLKRQYEVNMYAGFVKINYVPAVFA